MPRTILRHGDLANRHNLHRRPLRCFRDWHRRVDGIDAGFRFHLCSQRLATVSRALGYATAPGLITHSEVQEQDDGDGDGATYRAKLAYTYRVADREYTSAGMDTINRGRAIGGRIESSPITPSGSPLLVYYDPHDPADASLARRPGRQQLFASACSCFPSTFVMLGLWGVATGTIYRRVARPVAGGAKTWDDGGRVHVACRQSTRFALGPPRRSAWIS